MAISRGLQQVAFSHNTINFFLSLTLHMFEFDHRQGEYGEGDYLVSAATP
jgi:hypothetical protein